MDKKYTVADGYAFTYPADLISQQIVKSAGGVSHLPDSERKKVKFKRVGPGQDCSDMPKSSLALYASRGWVKEASIPVPVKELPSILDTTDEIEEN